VPPEQIRVDSFLLAEGAEAFNGKLYIHGGGWNYLNLEGPSAGAKSMALAGRIIVPWTEAGRELAFLVYLENPKWGLAPEDSSLFRILLKPQPQSNSAMAMETATPFAFNLSGSTFPESGEYAFIIKLDGEELARTRFQVNFPTNLQESDSS
jgi:hypothetical protein